MRINDKRRYTNIDIFQIKDVGIDIGNLASPDIIHIHFIVSFNYFIYFILFHDITYHE